VRRYFDYNHNELGITKAEYHRLCKAVEDGIVPEGIAFKRGNLNQYRYEPGSVDSLIRAWSGSSYIDPFKNRDINISQHDFEDIIRDAVSMTSSIKNYEVDGMTVYVKFLSNSKKQSWSAEFDFNDNGIITGCFKCYSTYPEAKAPRWFGENVSLLIRRMIDEGDYS